MDPLRIALLTSRRAPGIDHLLADPNRGAAWQLAIVVGSEPELEDLERIEAAGVPVELRPMREQTSFRNLRDRESYDADLAELFTRLNIDYILLDGYSYIVTRALLSPFRDKVLAIHDADLALRDADHLYTGPHAVRDAVLAGEPETRSSVYVVTEEIGRGPLFLLGPPYPVAHMGLDAREHGNADFLMRYAELHRAWMVSTCWGPMLSRTLELLAGGTSRIVGEVVWIDGAPGPCRMGEGPRCCHEPETMVARGIPRSCPFIA